MRPLLTAGIFFTLIACSEMKQTGYYQEEHRPQFHFSPDSMWMNDPNGMVYFEGEYHLFYQYHPYSTVWGPMHWGHAISRDLVKWEHLPIALYPDSLGTIFSGSAVIDWDNSSGLGDGEIPPMVAIYTNHSHEGEDAGILTYQNQSIAYSIDKGRSWTKYEKNPVLVNPGIKDFRDPKVIWHQQSERWIMALAVQDRIHFYSSSDLLEWEFISEFGAEEGAHGGVWECPDLFPLQDQDGHEHWVLLVSIGDGGPNGGSATQYFVGSFDGESFSPYDSTIRWIDWGKDNYAGVTWSDVPENDGRRIFMGWMSNWQYARQVPTEKWRSAMTLPRKLELVNQDSAYFLKSPPVEEVANLIAEKVYTEVSTINGGQSLEAAIPSLSQISMELSTDDLNNVILIELGAGEDLVSIEIEGPGVTINRDRSGIVDFNKEFIGDHAGFGVNPITRIDIYLDKSSVEVFANHGELVMTETIFPNAEISELKVSPQKTINLTTNIYQLKSTWQ